MICRGIACCLVIDVINSPQEYLLNVDVLPIILEFLPVKEIMRSRRVCKKWKEAVRRAIAHDNFYVESVEACNLLRAMVTALPNLQQLQLGYLGIAQKFTDGEDPDEEEATRTFDYDYTSHDIEIISAFRKLRVLAIMNHVPLNGRYPVLFNFPLLQKLSICNCFFLKWDLEMLAGLPVLKELNCYISPGLTGNISSLRVLKDTLEKVNILYGCGNVEGNINSLRVLKDTLEEVHIRFCDNVEGNFMDLADFPHLKDLDLYETAVTGDIRDISVNDFPLLESLYLPKTVYGGNECELQRISDGPDLIRAIYLLNRQRPALKMEVEDWKLSEDSPDWYEAADEDYLFTPPFHVCFVEAGPRVGYRWQTDAYGTNPCEANWLDPEPDRQSSEYEKYVEDLQQINSQVNIYRGYHQPPTEEEYNRLLDRFEEEGRWW